jgi:ribonucleoside-diphosphate reductase alpha chain
MSEAQVPSWMSTEAIETLSRGYLRAGESPRGMFERVAKTAAKYLSLTPGIEQDVFEILWRGFIGGASPVLSNFGASTGLPISCYSNHISDSRNSIYSHLKESSALSQYGGGVGTYFGEIRPAGAPISSGGKSTGVVPWMRQYDQCAAVVSQGGVRRGSFALYLPIDHSDLPEVLRAKDHSQGDPRDFIDSNVAVTITDEWVESMLAGDLEKKKIFGEVLKSRMVSGSPYIIFIDNANRANPDCYTQRGLSVKLSNLCSEIFLHTDENHTFVCVLSSLNLSRWDEWKDWKGPATGKSVPELAVYLLDAVVEEFCHKAQRITSMGRAVRFARKSRALGLGTMGLHALYQSKGLPFASPEARELNTTTHRFIKQEALKASKEMAITYGEPEWCQGTGLRHTHLMAIAPTKSNSVICGAGSEGIEPMEANYYVAKQAKGTFVRRNKYLEQYLEGIGKNTDETWESIMEFRGSVQHLDFIDNRAKDVFKTAREIDQFELIRQASDRQPSICQGQSLNLYVDPESTPRYLFKLHLSAWKGGLKSLYYLKSSSLLVKRNQSAQAKVARVVTKQDCPYCSMAKSLLKSQGWVVEETDRADVPDSEWVWKTVPQIWLNGQHVGGYTELAEKLGQGEKTYGECVACEG